MHTILKKSPAYSTATWLKILHFKPKLNIMINDQHTLALLIPFEDHIVSNINVIEQYRDLKEMKIKIVGTPFALKILTVRKKILKLVKKKTSRNICLLDT